MIHTKYVFTLYLLLHTAAAIRPACYRAYQVYTRYIIMKHLRLSPYVSLLRVASSVQQSSALQQVRVLAAFHVNYVLVPF